MPQTTTLETSETEEFLTADRREIDRLTAELAKKEERISQLEQLLLTDEKTGLFNEKGINAIADAAIEKRQRAVEDVKPYDPLSVLYLDLDGLKQFNDKFGHKTGNKAVYSSGKAIANSIRVYDSGGHPYGEEYIVLVEGDLKAAILVAQRIRERTHTEGVANELPVAPTFSIGITEFHPGDTRDTLYHLADQAMYRVKNNGKNGIAIGGVSEEREQEIINFINSPESKSGLSYNPEQGIFRDIP